MEKKRLIPVRDADNLSKVTLKEVSEEVYRSEDRIISRTRKKKQRSGECICPQSQLCLCDMDCEVCAHFQDIHRIHIEENVPNCKGDVRFADILEDSNSDFCDALADKLTVRKILAELGERDPEAARICLLIMDGLSEREAAAAMGMPRSTFKRRWAAIKDMLAAQLKEE